MATSEERLQEVQAQGMTRDQVVALLSAFIESNERYLARRRRRGLFTATDAFLHQVQPALALAIALLTEQEAQQTEEHSPS